MSTGSMHGVSFVYTQKHVYVVCVLRSCMYTNDYTNILYLRLFSNGGNYCREEIEFFDKKLVRMQDNGMYKLPTHCHFQDRLTSKIRSAHTSVVNEVGTALLVQQEQVTKKLQEFVER